MGITKRSMSCWFFGFGKKIVIIFLKKENSKVMLALLQILKPNAHETVKKVFVEARVHEEIRESYSSLYAEKYM